MAISKAEQAQLTRQVRELMARSPAELKTSAHAIYDFVGRYMAITQDYVGQMVGRYESQYRQFENMKHWIDQGDQATEAAAQKRNYAMAIVLGRQIQGRSEEQYQQGGLLPSLEHAVDELDKLTTRSPKPDEGWAGWQVAAATAGVGAMLVGVWLGVKAAK